MTCFNIYSACYAYLLFKGFPSGYSDCNDITATAHLSDELIQHYSRLSSMFNKKRKGQPFVFSLCWESNDHESSSYKVQNELVCVYNCKYICVHECAFVRAWE